MEAPRLFTNVDDLLGDVRAWIARDGLESTVLNTGNLSDSLAFERARPLAARLVELFRIVSFSLNAAGAAAAHEGGAPPVDERLAALDPLEEPDGLARYPFPDRIRMYRGVIDAPGDRVPVGLCEETAEAWTAVGLDPESKTCNCAT